MRYHKLVKMVEIITKIISNMESCPQSLNVETLPKCMIYIKK